MTGRTISHYKVLEKLGQGAMGEVWKAEDLDLRRIVALKFLSREMLGEEDIKARLIREAQAAASLDHPSVCHVYGIHQENGETFLAMAYIDGPNLAEKIKERPLPLEEALDIAVQISEGLQEAHDQGVVHRDIKPSNVMLDRRGRVKIMDFGLAAVADRTRLTKSGTTLGTPAYMSPEQAQGQDVDRSTDIWALGVVLYEMLAGKHPFPGEYEQAIVYSIINEAPEPVTALRTGVPTQYDQVVSKALAKDAEERYATVADLLVDLRHLRSAATRSGDTKIASPPPKQMRRTNRKLQFALIVQSVLLLALLGVGLILGPGSGDPHRQPQLLKFAVIPDDVVRTAVICPNARYLAYVTEGSSGPGLWIHDFRSDKPREIEGTAGAASPFWSPDSEFIGFAGGGGLKKVDAETGAIQSLYEFSGMGFFVGGTWSPDGSTIVFSRGAPPRLYEVSSRGGEPSTNLRK